jgi:hypothetical protein
MAEAMNDREFAQQCRDLHKKGLELMDTYLWTGRYYRVYNDPVKNKISDIIMPSQLDGEWVGQVHGFEVLPQDRLMPILATIKEFCLDDIIGAWTFAKPEHVPATFAGRKMRANVPFVMYFVPETSMVGMAFIGAGEKKVGMDILHNNLYNVTVRYRYAWDLPNMVLPVTGERGDGTEYYQNLVIWTAPAIIAGQDLKTYCRPGNFVDQILQAAKKKN